MKQAEVRLFKTCIKQCRVNYGGKQLIHNRCISPIHIYQIIEEFISYERFEYYLKKWSLKGFYKYDKVIYFGWFEVDNLPNEYKNLVRKYIGEREGLWI